MRAVVVGAGSIGALKPDKYDNPKSKNILTLAHAFYEHKKTELVGIVDIDFEKAKKAADKWKTKPYINIEEIDCDIIAVAVPDESHSDILQRSLLLKPHAIVAEKPFCTTTSEAQQFLDCKVPLAVDYIRRYDPYLKIVREQIGGMGHIFSCRVNYTRGFRRDASHAVDFCRWLFGEFKDGFQLLGVYDDYSKDDLTRGAYLQFENCEHVIFSPVDGRIYDIFEFDILTEKGRIMIVDHGKEVRVYPVIDEPTYGDYKALSSHYDSIETKLSRALLNLIGDVVMCVEDGVPLECTVEDAVKVHEIFDYLGV